MDEAALDEVFDHDYEHFMRHAHTAEFNRAEAELVRRVTGLRPGMAVLDAACGYGRMALELADQGLRVHGIDRSAPLIASARAEAAWHGCAATFEVGDLRESVAEPRYDAAVLWFTSLGYGDDADSRLVLRTLRRSLIPGGCLVIDAVHPVHEHAKAVAEDPRTRVWRAGEDVMVDEVRLDDTGSRITSRRTLVRDGRTRECAWSLRLPSLPEYEQWLHEAGFAQVRFLDGDGGPAHWSHRRLLVLAHTDGPPLPRAHTGVTACMR